MSSPVISKSEKLKCGEICPKSFKAAQAMATLGFICFLASVVVVFVKTFKMNENAICRTAAIVACLAGAAFALIGVIVYATQEGMEPKYLHFSFAFCVIAGIGGLVSGILQLISK